MQTLLLLLVRELVRMLAKYVLVVFIMFVVSMFRSGVWMAQEFVAYFNLNEVMKWSTYGVI